MIINADIESDYDAAPAAGDDGNDNYYIKRKIVAPYLYLKRE